MHPDLGHTAAFAEGRRLREASRRSRSHARRQRRVAGRRIHPAAATHWLLLAMAPFVAIAIAILGLTVAAGIIAGIVMLNVFPAVAVGLVGVAALRNRRRRALRRGGAAGTVPLPARPAAPPRPDRVWARARDRFHSLRAEYAGYECDPMEVLRIPALADVSVASTARFVDAFAEAQALETDALPPEEHRGSFVRAVDKAERAWRAARDAAERIRLSGLSPAERSTVERVIKLLTTARDSDSDPERLTAYAKARAELAKLDRAGVIHLPRTAHAVLDAAGRGILPA